MVPVGSSTNRWMAVLVQLSGNLHHTQAASESAGAMMFTIGAIHQVPAGRPMDIEPRTTIPTTEAVRPSTSPTGPRRRLLGGVAFAILGVLVLAGAFAGGALAERSGLLTVGATPPAPSDAPPSAPGTEATPDPADGTPGVDPSLPPLSEEEARALFQEAWDLVHERYVGRDELDERALAYGAIEGLTDAVGDRGHTGFETPTERELSNDALQGTYVGIGIYVDEHDDGIRVAGVIPRSPAAAAGLDVGDVIVGVNGRSIDDLSLSEGGRLIRGPEGTSVTLEVDPAGPPEPRDIRLTRASIDVPTVEWAMVPGTDVAHVRILQFSTGATDALEQALSAAKEAGARQVLLDLRGNPGGYVSEAVGVASQFLASGVVYQTEEADGRRTPAAVQPGGLWTEGPLVVLVDRSTASSAEIVASAIQDADRGTVVGEETFGTGTVVAEFALKDGSALRIGTVRWLTATGREIWHEGLEPDVPATLPEGVAPLSPSDVEELEPGEVDDMEDAILRRALDELQG